MTEYNKTDKKITNDEFNSELARCNKSASICHTAEVVAILATYVWQVSHGKVTLLYFLILSIIGLVSPVLEWFFYIRKHDTTAVKHFVGYGFGAFYTFMVLTTTNKLSFVYVIPMFIVISIFNDYIYSVKVNCACILVNIVQIIIFYKNGIYNSGNAEELQVQMLVMIMVALYSMYSSRISEKNNAEKLVKIRDYGDSTAAILANTVEVSNKMSDRIHVIDDKIKELDEAVGMTRNAMREVNKGSTDAAEAVQRQLEMTEDIQHKVEQVKFGTDNIISDITEAEKAVSEGNNNIAVLLERVNASVENGRLVTKDLEELKVIMEKMNSVVDIITDITSQTGLLALNATIEAARAGEAGKGFAVVASEISAMANNTQGATVKITDMINEVSDAINKVVDVTDLMIKDISTQQEIADSTADSFDKIKNNSDGIAQSSEILSEVVGHLFEANQKIVDSVSTISAISEEVSAHANNTFEISEHNGIVVAEVVRLSDELKTLTRQLKTERG